ncbi:hypothetical protein [Streptomyces yunnanensis]|uniref:Uncharacterized protein n=1 Tax=Streptomyces yunnanensis TaxID=156453 RepID=A0A9X8MU20_9ACTN|nr:hypothetical protein [Streptomyces yunnanensis]SHL81255.1 hypothetical protein SAMN05216268_106278 [Streptomyces yunnanensis]
MLPDFPAVIVNAITSFLGTLIEQVMKPLRAFLADTLLATPDITQHADVKRLWKATLEITVGIYVLFVTAGGITVMGHETVQTRYALKQILPRLPLGMIAAASSLTVMRKAISLSNALAHAIMTTDLSDAGQGMVERVLPFALFRVAGLKLYLLLLAIMMIALVLAVLIGFMVRVAVLALVAVCGPLALACHAHPLTDSIARLWWRAVAGCLVIQVAQSITFVLALRLFFAPGASTLGIPKSDQLGTLLAGLGLFWVLFKIPGWTLQVILRGTPVHQPHAPAAVRVLKHLALYQLMDHYLPATRLLRRRSGGAGGSGGGGGFGQGRGGPGGRRGPGGRGPGGGGRRGSRPSVPGPGTGGGTRSRVGRPAGPPGPTDRRGAAGTPAAGRAHRRDSFGARHATPAATTAPGPPPGRAPVGQAPRHRGPRAAPLYHASNSPRTALHTAPARLRSQLTASVPAECTPSWPSRPAQTRLPARTEGTPTRTSLPPRSGATTTPPSLARQPVRPVPAAPMRLRPVRPMQLQLPLEPPRR